MIEVFINVYDTFLLCCTYIKYGEMLLFYTDIPILFLGVRHQF